MSATPKERITSDALEWLLKTPHVQVTWDFVLVCNGAVPPKKCRRAFESLGNTTLTARYGKMLMLREPLAEALEAYNKLRGIEAKSRIQLTGNKSWVNVEHG